MFRMYQRKRRMGPANTHEVLGLEGKRCWRQYLTELTELTGSMLIIQQAACVSHHVSSNCPLFGVKELEH